jgi:hypothetical protein
MWGVVAALLLAAPAVCVAAAGAISQSYTTSAGANIAQGTLLSLTSSGSGVVEPAQAGSNTSHLVGVAAQSPLVELSAPGEDSVQAVVGGSTMALVSNINGTVVIGDRVTVSPLDGVGMKATQSATIVGTAQANLSSVKTVLKTILDKDGKSLTIKVGLVPISVNVTYYSATLTTSGSITSLVPPILQTAADALTGRQVSPARVLLATLALILGFVITIAVLTSSIRSEIISLGRNPLARNTLLRALVDVLIAAFGVLLVSLVAVCAIIWA